MAPCMRPRSDLECLADVDEHQVAVGESGRGLVGSDRRLTGKNIAVLLRRGVHRAVELSSGRRGRPRRIDAACTSLAVPASFVVADDREHLLGVDCGDVGLTLLLVDDDVAREQDAELGFGLQRGVCERRVAGAEDEVGLAVDAEFPLERRLDVDLAQHAEALVREFLAHPGHGLGEAELGRCAQRVAGVNLGHASSSSFRFALAALARCSPASAGSVKRSSR